MNGHVVAVNARAGDTVAPVYSAIIVIEAMKMEHALSVPSAMRVAAVHVFPARRSSRGSCSPSWRRLRSARIRR